MTIPTVYLNDSNTIPQIGLGTWPLNDQEAAAVVRTAIELGYRHIDTAYKYGNERGVGQGIRESGIEREELFITTKLDGSYQGNDRAIQGLDGCLERLGLDYVDLLLIHWPLPERDEYISTWKTFEKLVTADKVRSIGVSNFKPAHLERLMTQANIPPAVNQIQLNPRTSRVEQHAYNAEHGIITVAWGPLGPRSDLLQDAVLQDIATRHGKTTAQVVLRWHIQIGVVPIPKSAQAERLAQNIDIFDFALNEAELAAISALDTGAEPGVDSDVSGH